jgi:hypothetical protein
MDLHYLCGHSYYLFTVKQGSDELASTTVTITTSIYLDFAKTTHTRQNAFWVFFFPDGN